MLVIYLCLKMMLPASVDIMLCFFLIMKISLLQIFLKCPNFEVVLPTPGYTTSSDPAISHVFVLLILS